MPETNTGAGSYETLSEAKKLLLDTGLCEKTRKAIDLYQRVPVSSGIKKEKLESFKRFSESEYWCHSRQMGMPLKQGIPIKEKIEGYYFGLIIENYKGPPIARKKDYKAVVIMKAKDTVCVVNISDEWKSEKEAINELNTAKELYSTDWGSIIAEIRSETEAVKNALSESGKGYKSWYIQRI